MFDLIGDVHGCTSELRSLLTKLGYERALLNSWNLHDDENEPAPGELWKHPAGRKVVFVGDLNDRGPDSLGSIRLAMNMSRAGSALCVTGNHDDKLRRALKPGSKVTPGHGLSETLAQLASECPDWLRDEIVDFLESLPYQLSLDEGRLVVAHAGLPEAMHGKDNGKVRSHALYGDVDGKSKDEHGYPIRKHWENDYQGTAYVVHGHVPVKDVQIVNRVYDIDTGCAFGNKLTALRYPELEIVSVPAEKVYCPYKLWE